MQNFAPYAIGAFIGAIIGFLIARFIRPPSGGYLPIVGKEEGTNEFGVIRLPPGSNSLEFRDLPFAIGTVDPTVEVIIRGPIEYNSPIPDPAPRPILAAVSIEDGCIVSRVTASGLAASSVYVARLTVSDKLPDNTPAVTNHDYLVLTQ